MDLNQSLKLQQTLSPQMLQALALLPMPIQELKAMILNEIENNPALEIPESSLSSSESSFTNIADEEASDRKESFLENISKSESLSEHLLDQLISSDTTEKIEEISRLLISNLDSNGFYHVSLETLFENTSFKQDDIDKALELVRSFEPYGICVQDFRQSLIVQAKCSQMAQHDLEIFSKLVYNYLDKLKDGKTKEIAQSLRIPEEDVIVFYSILKSFNPFPGRLYSSDSDTFVVPEFSIHNENGTLVLRMNNADLPQLEISKDFEELAKTSNDKETSVYISSSIRQAKNLITQVEMRYKTLSKAAACLLEKQQDFFFEGPKALKAMTLKEVADEIGVHETTVSRLAQNKYVETDFGLFQMKYFFSQGVESSDGKSVSRNAVKEIISEMIKENPKLSAQKISDKLAQQGITCARRTVAKYLSEI